MADSKRGGRSSDDDYDEDDILDALDDDADDDADLDATDDGAARDRVTAGTRDRRSAAVARSGKTSREASKTKRREGDKANLFGRIKKFIREVVAELQKVIYPTRKELLTYTSVVLVFVVVVMTIVALLDVGFAQLMFLVFGDKTTT